MSGIGVEKISLFFTLLHLEKHVGVSPSSLRNMVKIMEEKLPPTLMRLLIEGIITYFFKMLNKRQNLWTYANQSPPKLELLRTSVSI
jgi:hypothetical protein